MIESEKMILGNLKKLRNALIKLFKKDVIAFGNKLKAEELSGKELEVVVNGIKRKAEKIADADKQISVLSDRAAE